MQSNCHFAPHQILYLEVLSTSSRDCCSSVTIGHNHFLAIEGVGGVEEGARGSAKWSDGGDHLVLQAETNAAFVERPA